MDRLSFPITAMNARYDVVVVGSGYGGGIAASRLARAGRSVCVLERGRERQPGEYPETLKEASRQVQATVEGQHVGSRLGLFDLRVNSDMSALVGCGLGGTSLINANVFIRPDERVFMQQSWPGALRNPSALDEGYERARQMLKPAPYPVGTNAYAALAKTDAQKVVADRLLDLHPDQPSAFSYVDINVNFDVDGPNAVGTTQHACTNCGNCVSGCNVGAKNTTLMNYLPDARNFGAHIFTQCAVRYVEREDDTWTVRFNWVGAGQDGFASEPRSVAGDIVILAAGTFGSTEILLRSRQRGLAVSQRLGKNFSGNGDVIGFGYDCFDRIGGVGFGSRPGDRKPPVGPCIASIIDRRDTPEVSEGSIIQEGSIPGALAQLLPAAFVAAERAAQAPTPEQTAKRLEDLDLAAETLLLGPRGGPVDHTQTLLVMAHDDADGCLALDDATDELLIDWPGVGQRPIFQTLDRALTEVTAALRGRLIRDPLWSNSMGCKLITVHPLGGCAMSDDAATGVVNDKGQVFSGGNGSSVHEGLYIADGSIVPASLGVNPLATISALAERVMGLLAADRGWEIDYDAISARPPDWPEAKPGIRFTETMKGSWGRDTVADYATAAATGDKLGDTLDFTVTIQCADLEKLMSDPGAVVATALGTVTCPALSDEPMSVTEGQFQLFVDDEAALATKKMTYLLPFQTHEGTTYVLSGFKRLPMGSALHAWRETTTLFVEIREGDERGKPIGKGILKIDLVDFARQLKTMTVTSVPNETDRLKYLERFGRFFAGNLWEQYGGVFGAVTQLSYERSPRKRRQLRVGVPCVHDFRTADGLTLRLTRYRGGDKGPVILAHGLGVSSLIFAIDTIETNLLEYLYGAGYDCWLLDYRCSVALPEDVRLPANGDDIARYDFPAAIRTVKTLTGASTVQVVAHCYGATTFTMAMLGGYLDPRDIRSAVISQISANVRTPLLTELKSAGRLPSLLKSLRINRLTALTDPQGGHLDHLFDRVAAAYAYPVAQGHCDDPVCHRITFFYGSLYRHDALNDDTHNVLHEMFGLAVIEEFAHLATMVRKGRVVTAGGEDAYYPHLQRMAIPIAFIHGAENECYLPASTKLTVDALSTVNGSALYDRHVIPGYGHIDCIFGKSASRDVFPHILEHLDRHQRSAD
jgi:cholesterol oxidase